MRASNRQAAQLFVFGLLIHAGWAATQGTPTEMDAMYYELVARHIADGDGAITRSTWSLAYAVGTGPQPADLHWMPLPSRVAAPGWWLLGRTGARLTGALLAAAWGPLAWALARRAGAAHPWLAGALALCGGVYARLLTSTDCYALYGVIGSVGLLAAADRRPGLAVLAGALAALTRNDGLLLSPMLALAFLTPAAAPSLGDPTPPNDGAATTPHDPTPPASPAPRLGAGEPTPPASPAPGHTVPRVPWLAAGLIAAAGPLTAAAWFFRSWQLGGDGWLAARRLVSGTPSYVAMFDGVPRGLLDVPGRLAALAATAPDVLTAWVTPGLIVLTVPAAWGAWELRRHGWVRALLGLILITPPLAVLAAPALATHGTIYRAAAATLPGQLALAAVGLDHLAALGARTRGYPPAFTRGLLSGAFALISIGMGLTQWKKPARPVDCALFDALPPQAAILTSQPLEVELACDRVGVMVSRALSPEAARTLAAEHGAAAILTAPAGYTDEASVDAERAAAWFPDWRAEGRLRLAP